MALRELFRQNLIYYRKEAGLTQERLSELAGCNLNYIASIECSAAKFPKPETIDSIAEALKINVSQLFEEQGCPVNAIKFSKEDFVAEITDGLHSLIKRDLENFLDEKI